jgi:hypothetical protein
VRVPARSFAAVDRGDCNAGVREAQGRIPSRAVPASTRAIELASIAPVRPEKLFRVADANAIVPRLQLLMERLQRAALRLHDEMTTLARETGVTVATLSSDELLRQRPEARLLVEELDAIVHEVEESGAHLKDIQLGLVDFPTEMDGEVAYLCWQFGESEVAFWHGLEDGFAGRRPLPGIAPARILQ